MTITTYFVEEIKTKRTIARDLPSIGDAVKTIKNLGKSLSEFKIVSKPIHFTKTVKSKNLLISGMSDEDIELVLKGNVLPIYNNPAQIDDCDMTIVFSENKVLIGKLISKEKYSSEGAPLWKNIKGKKGGYNDWNTNLMFEKNVKVFEREEFEKNNFKLKGTQGGVGYKNSTLNLEF